jgi:AcrR family transcriptional regulator
MTAVSSISKEESASHRHVSGISAAHVSAKAGWGSRAGSGARLAKADPVAPKSGVGRTQAEASRAPRISASQARHAAKSTKRDQLLETAWRLFYRDGYHATGIDRILAEAGVAKMTLYKHFRSKEELILAVLEKRSQLFSESFSRFLQAKKRTPDQQLLAVFEWLIAWIKGKEFRGCFFQKAMAEYQEVQDPIHQAALAHKTAFHAEIRRLVAVAGLTRAKGLADQLALLVEGAIVNSHAIGSSTPAMHAKEAAVALIKNARR